MGDVSTKAQRNDGNTDDITPTWVQRIMEKLAEVFAQMKQAQLDNANAQTEVQTAMKETDDAISDLQHYAQVVVPGAANGKGQIRMQIPGSPEQDDEKKDNEGQAFLQLDVTKAQCNDGNTDDITPTWV